MSRSRCLKRGDEVLVRPAHIVNPHDFYVRLASDDDWITTFQELIDAHMPLSYTQESTLKIGILVLLQHPQHGWARGIITAKSKEARFTVRYLDYGDVVHGLRYDALYRLDWGDATAPKAIHCRLHQCEPKTGTIWSPASIKSFINFVGGNTARITVMGLSPLGDQYVVQLNSGWPETVSMLMVIAEAACFGGYPQQVNKLVQYIPRIPIKKYHFFNDQLKIGEKIKVKIIKLDGVKFFSIKVERMDCFEVMNELLENQFECCECVDDFELTAGTSVLCKITRRSLDRYFRGKIISVTITAIGKQARIHLVDLGDYETVACDVEVLRKCNDTLLEEPVFAIPCTLIDDQIKNNLHSKLSTGLSFHIIAVENKSDTYVVCVLEESLPKI